MFRIQKKEKIILLQWSWADEVTQEIAWGGGILEKTSPIVRTQSWPDASLPDPETLRAAEEIMGSGSARASPSLHSGSLPDQQVWHFYPQFPPVRLFRLVSRPSYDLGMLLLLKVILFETVVTSMTHRWCSFLRDHYLSLLVACLLESWTVPIK